MPTVTYSEEEYLVQLNKARTLEEQVQLLESYRPIWAMGLTSDSQAAQTWANATLSLWERLGANDQTQAMLKLDEALAKAQVLQPLTPDDVDLIAADGMRSATGGIYATQVYGFAEQIQRTAARKWGLVLAGGEQG